MPKCSNCGNKSTFGASAILPVAASANGPLTALTADFNENDEIIYVNSMIVDKKILGKVFNNPGNYLDICLKCGNNKIDWNIEK